MPASAGIYVAKAHTRGAGAIILDLEAMADAARKAKQHGFDGTGAVHPSSVPILNTGFAPSRAQIAWARKIIATAAATRA